MWSVWNAQAYTMYHVLTRCDPYEMHAQCTMYYVQMWPCTSILQCTMY